MVTLYTEEREKQYSELCGSVTAVSLEQWTLNFPVHHPIWRYNSAILGFLTRWRWVVSFMPQPLYTQGKRIGGWMSPTAGLNAVRKRTISCPWQESSSDRPARSYIDWAISDPTIFNGHRYNNKIVKFATTSYERNYTIIRTGSSGNIPPFPSEDVP
jgi:hypothetical protein